jgi:hypothetical protein
MTQLIDRRRSPRISCNIAVDYTPRDMHAQMGRITNIGTAGVCLATQRLILPAGADVLLHFRLPIGKRPIQAGGTVRWAAQWTAGIELVHVSFQDQDEIWRYYARESARQRGGGVRPAAPPSPIQDPAVLGETVLDAWRRFIRERG